MACTCLAETNAMLADHNGVIVSTMFSEPQRVCVEVEKLRITRGSKRPPRVLATYCPFCGVRYEPAPQPPCLDCSPPCVFCPRDLATGGENVR